MSNSLLRIPLLTRSGKMVEKSPGSGDGDAEDALVALTYLRYAV